MFQGFKNRIKIRGQGSEVFALVLYPVDFADVAAIIFEALGS